MNPSKNPKGSHGKWYMYLHEWLTFMVNVGKYTIPMDFMGIVIASPF